MKRQDWSWIAHDGIDLMSPLAHAKVDEVVGLLDLPPGARVVDLGCGKGELLLRIAERYAIRGLGVDRSPALLELARDAAAARSGDAGVDDFDRYEWRWSRNGERYASAHRDEPGVDEFLAWIRNGRRRYVELGGRETLGFGLFLFARGAAA